jgi:hypothetical protein
MWNRFLDAGETNDGPSTSNDQAMDSIARLAILLARNDTNVIIGPENLQQIKQVHYIARMPEIKVRGT